jgi:hypothetical protein
MDVASDLTNGASREPFAAATEIVKIHVFTHNGGGSRLRMALPFVGP